jgi:hypothetical protein
MPLNEFGLSVFGITVDVVNLVLWILIIKEAIGIGYPKKGAGWTAGTVGDGMKKLWNKSVEADKKDNERTEELATNIAQITVQGQEELTKIRHAAEELQNAMKDNDTVIKGRDQFVSFLETKVLPEHESYERKINSLMDDVNAQQQVLRKMSGTFATFKTRLDKKVVEIDAELASGTLSAADKTKLEGIKGELKTKVIDRIASVQKDILELITWDNQMVGYLKQEKQYSDDIKKLLKTNIIPSFKSLGNLYKKHVASGEIGRLLGVIKGSLQQLVSVCDAATKNIQFNMTLRESNEIKKIQEINNLIKEVRKAYSDIITVTKTVPAAAGT